MVFLISMLFLLIDAFIWVMIIGIIMSWLIAFNVLDIRNKWVEKLYKFLTAIVDPVLEPIRKVIPPIGGIDISPIVVIILAELLRYLISQLLYI